MVKDMGTLHPYQMENPIREEAPVVVVIVPLPAQGHLNQLLHFSCHISARGVPVHFVGSATHNTQAKIRVQGWDPLTISNIHFHDLPLPPFPAPPPDPNAHNKFPAHLQPAFEAASLHFRQPLAALLRTLCSTTRRVAVIHDSLMSFAAQESAALPNAEAYVYPGISAFSNIFIKLEFFKKFAGQNVNISQISHLPALSDERCFTNQFWELVRSQVEMMDSDVCEIYNTCRAVEGEFLDLLNQPPFLRDGRMRPLAVGPLHPIILPGQDGSTSGPRHECLEWLDKQPFKSVLYVSFGSNSSLSEKEILELALGLKHSKQRFVWVLREADRGDIFAEDKSEKKSEKYQLPESYEEGLERVGMVVRDWAPQLDILAHRSTGGFLSHCGWNSCIESMSMGVPIAAWPMHSDQPWNAMLVTEVLKIGVPVMDWARREEMVLSAAVEAAVRRLMVTEEGKDMRSRAEEMGEAIRKAWLEDGSSRTELDYFIAHISR
ncbi:zeatin O-glucosyltransferase-like [Tasmannia lanceolata]|uniref:zeatin O-glucosyltransferase-like n=1 Tax=Tasmannia lanceolata TaxID=3420 RepID=UPI004063C1C7